MQEVTSPQACPSGGEGKLIAELAGFPLEGEG